MNDVETLWKVSWKDHIKSRMVMTVTYAMYYLLMHQKSLKWFYLHFPVLSSHCPYTEPSGWHLHRLHPYTSKHTLEIFYWKLINFQKDTMGSRGVHFLAILDFQKTFLLKSCVLAFLNIFQKMLQKWTPITLFNIFWYPTLRMWNFHFSSLWL